MPWKDPAKRKEYVRNWAKARRDAMTGDEKKVFYQDRYRAIAISMRECRIKLRDKAIDKLGGRCSNSQCSWVNSDGSRGCLDRRCLQIDHRNGGGNKERKQLGGGATSKIYKAVLADVTGRFQLLCANCNWIKRYENKEYL